MRISLPKYIILLIISLICMISINFMSNPLIIYRVMVYILLTINFIYLIFLLLKYEKENKSEKTPYDENKLLKKYNPLVAGCIVDNRKVIPRDILAIMLNLVRKNVIELIPAKDSKGKKIYYAEEVRENNDKMDFIEHYIYDWFFEKNAKSNIRTEIVGKVDFSKKIKNMQKDKAFKRKFKELNYMVIDKLNRDGANFIKVPEKLKELNISFYFINIFIFLASIFFSAETASEFLFDFVIIMPLLFIADLCNYAMYIEYFINVVSTTLMKIIRVDSNSNKKTIFIIISVLLIFGIIILNIANSQIDNKYILNVCMLGIATIIICVDDYIMKHNVKISRDYANLIACKKKIEYSLLNEKDLEDIVLWEEYLVYSVAFGNSSKISKRVKKMESKMGFDSNFMNAYHDTIDF